MFSRALRHDSCSTWMNAHCFVKIFTWFLVVSGILYYDLHVLHAGLKEIKTAIAGLPDVLASHLSNMSL